VAAEAERLDSRRPKQPARALAAAAARVELPLVALWLGLGWALSELTTRVVDWFVMTDELLYERLGLSAARSFSPLPRVHGELIPNVNQLYPLLLAPLFRHGYVPQSLHAAHLLNAFVMTSASVPAFLIARRATSRRWAAYLVAVLSVCVPWIVYSSFLLTEVSAYPAFLWALLAFQRTLVTPSRRNDALALAGLALAILARTQFVLLAVVLPLALLAVEGRRTVERHRLLGWAYALLAAAVLVLLAIGRLESLLGTYGSTVRGNLLPSDSGRSLLEHIAVLALGLGLLPFVLGTAWVLAGLRRSSPRDARAFSVLASITLGALLLEVTLFDLRFGGGTVRDRYLFYGAPLILVGFAGALRDQRLPRWALLPPTAAVAAGLALAKLPSFDKLNIDAPVSDLDNYLLASTHSLTGARVTLVLATVLLVALFLQAVAFLPRAAVTTGLALLTLAAFSAQTTYAFVRLFRVDGTSGRPLTLEQGNVFDWIDREALNRDAKVTMIPYPMLPGEYWASVAFWWDLEFWNTSVVRAAYYPKQYEGTPSTFPKLYLSFDPNSGFASRSPTPYVAQSAKETRFRIAGNVQYFDRDVLLTDAGARWRTDWLSYGLYDDGWTRPGAVVRIRIFAVPGQRGAVTRSLTLAVRAPADVAARPFTVSSNATTWRGRATDASTALRSVSVCVPARGFTEVRLRANGASRIYGDMRDQFAFGMSRVAGVFLAEIALADEVGPACSAGPPHERASG
jgi:hypothetical protein